MAHRILMEKVRGECRELRRTGFDVAMGRCVTESSGLAASLPQFGKYFFRWVDVSIRGVMILNSGDVRDDLTL